MAAADFPSLDAAFATPSNKKAPLGKKAQARAAAEARNVAARAPKAAAADFKAAMKRTKDDEAAMRDASSREEISAWQQIVDDAKADKAAAVKDIAIRKAQWKPPTAAEELDCSVCFCPLEEGDKVFSCMADIPHYMDAACFQHALSTLTQDATTLPYWEQHKALKCMMCNEPVHEKSVFASGDSDCIQAYVQVTRHIACSVERLDAQRKAEKMAMEDSADAKQVLVQRMIAEVDVVMTTAISCPYCQTPFFDFNGCLALTCAACNRGFCGICCCKNHTNTDSDSHASVRECMQKMSPEQNKTYGFHGEYFIGEPGWVRWKDKLRTEALYDYLRTLRVEFVWEFFHLIHKKLKDDKLLPEPHIAQLKGMIFSHKKAGNLHLVRLPNTFWLVYSAKTNTRFVDAVKNVALSSDQLKKMGMLVVFRIREAYPNWEAVKKAVPGESFESINYPPEFLPLIATVVEEWGRGIFW